MNIKTELTQEQAVLVINAITAEINKGRGTFLSANDVYQLAQVAHNLHVRVNFPEAQ